MLDSVLVLAVVGATTGLCSAVRLGARAWLARLAH